MQPGPPPDPWREKALKRIGLDATVTRGTTSSEVVITCDLAAFDYWLRRVRT